VGDFELDPTPANEQPQTARIVAAPNARRIVRCGLMPSHVRTDLIKLRSGFASRPTPTAETPKHELIEFLGTDAD
jgi:hypothetical protein